MNQSILQQWIDEILESSGQQWLLRLGVVAASVGAVGAVGIASDHAWPLGLFAVGFLSMAAAMRPDTQLPAAIIAVVVWRWLATVGDVDTPWLPAVGCCLLALHALTALMASVPTGGVFTNATLGVWARRTMLGAATTVGVWFAVVLFDRREAAGNGFLTGTAVAVVAGAAAFIRVRSLDETRQP